jgi:hypothetical protein
LTPDRRISLFERREECGLPFEFDSDPIIGDLELKTTAIVVAGVDVDCSAGRGEFYGVVNQVPECLVDAYRVGLDVMLLRIQLRGNRYLLCCDT